jgi:hypothetical protein
MLVDIISPDGTGGWKVTDSNKSGHTPSPADAASFGEAITQKQKEMDRKNTMTFDDSKATSTTWYAIEKGDNLWSMTKQHLETTWGRSVSDKEVANYWQDVCKDNPFVNDNIIQPGQVVAFRDPGADPKNPAGTGKEIDDKARSSDSAVKGELTGDLNKYFSSLDASEKKTVVIKLLETTHTAEGRRAVVDAYLASLPSDAQRNDAAKELTEKYPHVNAQKGQSQDGGGLTDEERLNNQMPGIIGEALAAANASS